MIGNKMELTIPFYDEEKIRSEWCCRSRLILIRKKQRYKPCCEPVKGLYLGDALVANSQGKEHLKIYNVTERNYTIILNP